PFGAPPRWGRDARGDGGAPVTSPALWRINARPASLVAAGVAWREIARTTATVGTRTERAAQTLLQAWDGEAARAYAEHDRRSAKAFAELSTVAEHVGGLLDDGAAVLRQTQHHLDEAWELTRRRLVALDPDPDLGGSRDLRAYNAAQLRVLRAAESEAVQLRSHADATL